MANKSNTWVSFAHTHIAMKHLIYLSALLVAVCSCTAPNPTVEQEQSEQESPQTNTTTTVESPYLRPKQILPYVEQSPSVAMPDQLPAPFDRITFARVVAYDFNKRLRPFSSVLKLSEQRYAADIEKQQALNAQQIAQLLDLLTNTKSFGGIQASCFDPRMGFIFYQGTQAQLVVDICLDCNYLRSTAAFPAMTEQNSDADSREAFHAQGFSNLGREKIIKLAAALELHYGQLGPEDYDFSIGE